ncbi:6-phosphogluconate dehydrogenase NAD-binding [Ignisphaera aggregans DSM 17230]|uniref:6-phosphogluconate dehydrogenase NAD-binding n=1 Tax=Ignisphaera aggregans (strain DSM 17230 / JCM 13409 / AQ1.S1) TaxID=583356 RepID=E0SS01_IGNAA|nr:6-phosphogluconate dehydrogenase NAD-binding [Ignisphaera aggregans DSM 17230]
MDIGIVGLGLMGSNLVRCLRNKNIGVVVYNRTRSRAEALCREVNCVVVDSPREVADRAMFIIVFVADDDALRDVVFGSNGIVYSKNSSIIINASTITPMMSMYIYENIGKRYLEAPVYGSVDAAKSCSLLSIVAGDENVYREARGVIDLYSSKSIYVGEIPKASVLKLALNNVGMSFPIVLSESLAMLEAWGIDKELFREIAKNLWFGTAIERYWHRVTGPVKEPSFRLRLAAKDYSYVAKTLQIKNIPAFISSSISNLLTLATAEGYGDFDYTKIGEYLVELAKRGRNIVRE